MDAAAPGEANVISACFEALLGEQAVGGPHRHQSHAGPNQKILSSIYSLLQKLCPLWKVSRQFLPSEQALKGSSLLR